MKIGQHQIGRDQEPRSQRGTLNSADLPLKRQETVEHGPIAVNSLATSDKAFETAGIKSRWACLRLCACDNGSSDRSRKDEASAGMRPPVYDCTDQWIDLGLALRPIDHLENLRDESARPCNAGKPRIELVGQENIEFFAAEGLQNCL